MIKAKIEITQKQAQQFNFMRAALTQIANYYQTPSQIRKDSKKDYGLDFEEAIEMAYENIQILAKQSIRGVKPINHDQSN